MAKRQKEVDPSEKSQKESKKNPGFWTAVYRGLKVNDTVTSPISCQPGLSCLTSTSTVVTISKNKVSR